MPHAPKFRLLLITINGYLSEQLDGVRGLQRWQSWHPGPEDLPLVAGPGNPRLMVLDYDADGDSRAGAQLKPRRTGEQDFEYEVELDGVEQPHLLRQVSVFSTMLRTLSLFEADDILARSLRWATDSKLLRVIINKPDPRGASYDRIAGAITFASFPSRRHPGAMVHTAGCPDIVAHETAHAVLDALAPDLYHGLDPQCSAIHEAIADLTAMFVALEMDSLRRHILEQSDGDMRSENAFGWIAEEYGFEQDATGTSRSLRSLYSEASFREGSEQFVPRRGGHYEQSVVFSSAYYTAMIDEYDRIRAAHPTEPSGLALYRAATKFRRALARALDYLPPSNVVTLLDLCRTILLADAYAYPDTDDGGMRDKLRERFVDRGIGERDDFVALATERLSLFDGRDIESLVAEPAAIEAILKSNRELLHIPDDAELSVTVRLAKKKRWLSRQEARWISEAIIKFSWRSYERIDLSNGRRRRLDLKQGTTLVVNPDSGALKLLLTTNRALDGSSHTYNAERREAQREYVRGLIDSGRFEDASGLPEEVRRGMSEPHWYVEDEIIQLRNVNVGKALHAP